MISLLSSCAINRHNFPFNCLSFFVRLSSLSLLLWNSWKDSKDSIVSDACIRYLADVSNSCFDLQFFFCSFPMFSVFAKAERTLNKSSARTQSSSFTTSQTAKLGEWSFTIIESEKGLDNQKQHKLYKLWLLCLFISRSLNRKRNVESNQQKKSKSLNFNAIQNWHFRVVHNWH